MLKVLPGQTPQNIEYWDVIYHPEEEDKGEAYYVERLRASEKSHLQTSGCGCTDWLLYFRRA